MIGYACKYTPVELLEALGAQPVRLDSQVESFRRAEELVHPNLCSHAKALVEQSAAVDELVLTNCCDSARRVFETLQAQGRHKFLHLLDLPHRQEGCARAQYKGRLQALMEAYRSYRGAPFDPAVFRAACARSRVQPPQGPFLAVLGARVSRQLLEQMSALLPLPLWDLTCSGNRALGAPPDTDDPDELLSWYAGELLSQVPCMRMEDISSRRRLWELPNLRGVVYHTVKFCDFYPFEYETLKKRTQLPVVKLESDFTPAPPGQLSTRLQAFAEQLGGTVPMSSQTPKRSYHSPYAVGVDSGSTTTNMVVLTPDRRVAAWAIVPTGPQAQRGAAAALEAVAAQLAVPPESLAPVVATGYGRGSIPYATDQRTEITCHARGVHFLDPAVRTVIDIGGQDSKVISLDESGAVVNFVMNDKCAAGTGRFLELMARTLELTLPEFSAAGLTWTEELTISSMCTVFAESEVVSLIAENKAIPDIVHALNRSVASKTASMVAKTGSPGPYMMTGGVARNTGVVRALESALGAPLRVADAPDLCGALGAALFALEL